MIRPTPDSSRLLMPTLTYAGEAPRGQTLPLPHGALLGVSGLPALLPTPRAAPAAQAAPFDWVARLDGRYWTVDGQRSASFAIAGFERGFTVTGTSRRRSDLIGVQWFSEDALDHRGLAYEANFDYRGLRWSFDIELSDSLPPLEDEQLGLTLTVETGVGPRYVRLANYASRAGRRARVTLDFDALHAGFGPGLPGWELVDASRISQMFFSVVPPGFDAGSSEPHAQPVDWTLRVTDMRAEGAGRRLRRERLRVAPHDLRMCTAYDDHYNQSPARVLDNIMALGYREWINHYCGMSHYMEVVWNAGEARFVIDRARGPVLNRAARAWHEDFLARAHAAGFVVIQSVSYEIFSETCPYDWAQRDREGVLGTTGYTPPSYLISPCVDEAVDYVGGIMARFGELARDTGMPVYVQIGEPWWWYQPSTGKPCVYDYPTLLRYNEQTGRYAPDLGTITPAPANQNEAALHFQTWLSGALDDSNQRMRAAVKAAVPGAKVAPLFFLPTILDPSSGIMSRINYPRERYAAPHYDFMQTEAYDWTTAGLNDAAHAYRAYTIPVNELGYAQRDVHVLIGFATSSSRAQWAHIFEHNRDGQRDFPGMQRYVWAYPQVMRDSIVYRGGPSFEFTQR